MESEGEPVTENLEIEQAARKHCANLLTSKAARVAVLPVSVSVLNPAGLSAHRRKRHMIQPAP